MHRTHLLSLLVFSALLVACGGGGGGGNNPPSLVAPGNPGAPGSTATPAPSASGATAKPSTSPSPSPTPTVSITEFAVPAVQTDLAGLTNGPDGNIWFTAGGTLVYGYITPSGAIKEFSAAGITSYPGTSVGQIAAGSGQTLWFAYTATTGPYSQQTAYMFQVSTTGTVLANVSQTDCPPSNAPPATCAFFGAVEPGGASVLAALQVFPCGECGRPYATLYTITSSNSLQPLYNTSAQTGSNYDLLQSSSGVWASWQNYNCPPQSSGCSGSVTFVSPGGTFVEYDFPQNYAVEYGVSTNSGSVGPYSTFQDLTIGPDGALWVAMYNSAGGQSALGRLGSDGSITAFPIGSSAQIAGITTGSDGALWFTEGDKNTIGRMTTSGTVTQYAIPTTNSYPGRIIAGQNRTLWFTEVGAGKIGRISY